MPLTLGFDSPDATLENSGGKGVNLVRLYRAGFPVPPGFVITTEAYREFIRRNGLAGAIGVAVSGLDPTDLNALEMSAAAIRTAFVQAHIPLEIVERVQTAALAWARTPLAVRSSATAEDLPDLSFAGQQETFLNVIGPDALLRAVVDCWASLWTARAIGYRLRAGIAHEDVAIAVVVQKLVDSDVSGVLFTANPLTGHRGQTVIDATYGLGEALVSGQVEPDHVVADTATGAILERTIGAKATRTSRRQGGGIVTQTVGPGTFSLNDEQVHELVDLGRRVQHLYDEPQDLEWAIAGGAVHLLQARAITSLYPLPEHTDPGLGVWFSFGAVQGMLDPITPLGAHSIADLLDSAAGIFGAPHARRALNFAGERAWVRIDPVLRNPLGRKIALKFLPYVEPGSLETLTRLLEDPRLAEHTTKSHARALRVLLPFMLRVLVRALWSLAAPVSYRRYFERRTEAFVAEIQQLADQADARPDARARLAARLGVHRNALARVFPLLLPRFGPIMMPCIVMTARLNQLASSVGSRPLAMEALRSLPGNPTTAMDLALWSAAEAIAADSASRTRFRKSDAAKLARDCGKGSLPPVAMEQVGRFLASYGMRGVAEIDLGVPRWREQPEAILATLQTYATLKDPELAPDKVFSRGEAVAQAAVERLARLLEDGTWRGFVRAHQARFFASRIRGMFGARETPKFTIVRVFGIIRAGLLASGAELVEAGLLDSPQDVFFLRSDELAGSWDTDATELRALVRSRRAAYDRERRRRQVPRLILSDGETFYDGAGHVAPDGAIVGSPVSPGVVEGRVRVVLDPLQAGLERGEILVCPGTDPAWTPLFLTAAGLVTEVGGMMTHGSVVAREYGIPAVVGVHAATSRLVTGTLVRLDGNAGTIELLEADAP